MVVNDAFRIKWWESQHLPAGLMKSCYPDNHYGNNKIQVSQVRGGDAADSLQTAQDGNHKIVLSRQTNLLISQETVRDQTDIDSESHAAEVMYYTCGKKSSSSLSVLCLYD